MQIVKEETFLTSLQTIMNFIAKDSINRALDFEEKLREKLETLDNFPYKCRQSIYFENEEIRDYIFMGYVVPYFIDVHNDRIVILDIIKYQSKDTK